MARIQRQGDFDWAGADNSIRRAIALEPGDPAILQSAASSAATLGRFDEALRLAHGAVNLDPLSPGSWECLSENEFLAGQLDEAAAHSKKALDLSPDAWPGPFLLSEIYVMQGRPQDALPEIKLIRYDVQRAFLYPIAYHALGQQKGVRCRVEQVNHEIPCKQCLRDRPDLCFPEPVRRSVRVARPSLCPT